MAQFTIPPLDGTLSFSEILEFNAKCNSDNVLYCYGDEVAGARRDILWSEAIKAFRVAAQLSPKIAQGKSTVVGILANADSVTYTSFMMGMMGVGVIPFPISPRNSPAAVGHLLKTTQCSHLYVTADVAMQNIAALVKAELGDDLEILHMPTFADLYLNETGNDAPLLEATHVHLDSPLVICHSSGTTRFPSPITHTQRAVIKCSQLGIEHAAQSNSAVLDACGAVFSFHAPPVYHVMGCWSIFLASLHGIVVATFPPQEPPVIPTPDRVLSGALKTNCDVMFSVPVFVEIWSKTSEGVEAMKKFKSIVYGGGPLAVHVGDELLRRGVNLSPAYACTEALTISLFVAKKPSAEGWDWLQWAIHITPHLIPYEGEDNVYRLVIKANPAVEYTPSVINTEIDGVPAYDTKDLVLVHPENPNLFKVFGRYDEQIMHSTGEKTNPIPIEAALCKDPWIGNAIMFGRSKFQPGVLIIPTSGHEIDPADEAALIQFKNSIWDSVELANNDAPQHSRIFKEMILVTKASKPIEYTAKGPPRRPSTLAQYAEEIEALYASVDEISQSKAILPASWSLESVIDFVRTVVNTTMHISIADDQDIFASGGDSLVAVAIRNSILGMLRKSKRVAVATIRGLRPTFVFELPTVTQLGNMAFELVKEAPMEDIDDAHADVWGTDMDAFSEMPQVGKTVIELRKGQGECPLIVIHGGGGVLYDFASWPEKFHEAVWAIQLTPDAPLTSLEELASFYVAKIKEKRPAGPYRLAGYSASSVVVVLIALQLESSGDEVSQLAFLDMFPTLFSHIANLHGNPDPATHSESHEQSVVEGFRTMFSLDSSRNDTRTVDSFTAAFRDPNAQLSPVMKLAVQNIKTYGGVVDSFLYNLATADKGGLQSMEKVHEWVRQVKAPMTVFVAKSGTRALLQDTEEWADLGARRAVFNVQVVDVDGGHFEFLWDDKVIKGLQLRPH